MENLDAFLLSLIDSFDKVAADRGDAKDKEKKLRRGLRTLGAATGGLAGLGTAYAHRVGLSKRPIGFAAGNTLKGAVIGGVAGHLIGSGYNAAKRVHKNS